MEDNLGVRVVIIVILETFRRLSTVVINVKISKGSRLVWFCGGKVKVDWGLFTLINPGIPVDGGKNMVDIQTFIVILNPSLPSCSSCRYINTGQRVLQNIMLEEFLHGILSNHWFNVMKELESLLIRNFRESVVWVVTVKNRVDAWVSVV